MISLLTFSPFLLLIMLVVLIKYARDIGNAAAAIVVAIFIGSLVIGVSHLTQTHRSLLVISISNVPGKNEVQQLRLLSKQLAASQNGELTDASDGWTFQHRPIIQTEVEISAGSMTMDNIGQEGAAMVGFYGDDQSPALLGLMVTTTQQLRKMGFELHLDNTVLRDIPTPIQQSLTDATAKR
jgi:hypothetical protein